MQRALEGKVAVVTGASKGIGAAIAAELAASGADVVVNYASDADAANRVVESLGTHGGRYRAIRGDIRDPASVARLFDEAAEALGPIDILVNNAGVYEFGHLEAIDEAHMRRMFDLNVFGLLHATRSAVGRMPARGGTIVNVSSVVSTFTPPGASVYAATKASVDAITRCLAKELAPRGIRVNAVNPGLVETEGVRAAGLGDGGFRAGVEAQTPLGRIGRPSDIAPAVLFLASEASAWMTGETLVIAGGLR